MSTIVFENDAVVVTGADPGATLLQISRDHGIPHIHACGGNTRCSTYRVIVIEGFPRNEREAKLARSKGLEPNIRLACQTQVGGGVVEESDTMCGRRMIEWRRSGTHADR